MADCVIPEGYKETALGVVPKEWEVKRLGDICSYFKSGESITSKDISEKGKYPVYGGNGLRGYTDKKYTHDGTYILIGRQGALCGNINYVIGKCYISEHAIAVQTKNNSLWLRYKLDFWNLNRYSESSAQPGLSVEKLIRYKLTVPPLGEQQKISEVLSVWDKAIEKQTQLIEKLELRKKGLMQQLLTGKKRLPGFSGEWKKVLLGDVACVVGGGTPDTEVNIYWNGSIPWFTPTEIGEEKYVAVSKRCITVDGVNNSSAKILPVGTILFTSRASIGLKAILLKEATTNQGFQSLIVNKDNDIEYVYYLLDIIKNNLIRKASGSTFLEISSSSMQKVSFEMPELLEQTAIANIISLCDNEILLAKQTLNKFSQQKKGLMQVLLTGKKRVKQ